MAPIQFLLPLFASILQGALGHGLAEGARAREGNEQRRLARSRREQLQPLIDQLTQARDHSDLEEQFVRDFSRAGNQLTAQAASTGMTDAGTGGLDSVRGDLLASGLAQLAQAKQADEARRQELLAQLLSDHSLYAGEGADESALGAGLLGGLLGGVQGAGSNLASYFSSDAGMQNLASWLGGQGGQQQGAAPGFDPFQMQLLGASSGGVRPPAPAPAAAPRYYMPYSRTGATLTP